jgi:hypothetical protein
MTDQPQASSPPPLSEEEKARLRRCYRIRRITDDEIAFRIEPASGKAAWFTMLWFVMMGGVIVGRWAGVPSDAPSAAWMLLGVAPTFLIMWLAGRRSSSLVVGRGARSMDVVFHDGRWTIKLPRGSSPAEWGGSTATVPIRWKSDEVERVAASEVLERFSGSSLSEPREDTFLPLLNQCNADVVGYNDQSVSIANFSSARQWVVAAGVALFIAPTMVIFWMVFVSTGSSSILVSGLLSALGGSWILYDGRASSVATFLKGKRKVVLHRRGIEHTHDVSEDAVRTVGEHGEFVGVGQVFSCSPAYGTAELLAGFLRKYLSPAKATKAKPTMDT